MELAKRTSFWGIWTLFILKLFICSFRNEQSEKKLLHKGDICGMNSFRLGLATVPCEAVTLLTEQISDKLGKLGSPSCLIFVALLIFADSDIWNVN